METKQYITMDQLPWGEIGGDWFNYELPYPLLVRDGGFDNKPDHMLDAGNVVQLKHCQNFGMLNHEITGIYRY